MKVDFATLDRGFNPRCVAVIGDSKKRRFQWLHNERSFAGKLYSVQLNPESIEGIKALGIENYHSLLEIPEAVDLAVVTVPRKAALSVLEDCIRKGVAVAQFFTSGFSETGDEEGIKLERLLAKRAEEANFHLIGPNCLGIFNPRVGIKQNYTQYSGVTGHLGFISQSGTHANDFSQIAHLQGLDIAKSVSFGNGTVIDSPDYLEYFSRDPEIKIIGMYLEGVKDGRRFYQVLHRVAAQKPVVIWKGGRTEAGGRAIASHTGSLAVSQTIWEAAVKQCGAVTVEGMEELVDTLKAVYFLSPVYGNRVGVAGGSGGQSVAIADEFTGAGLNLPSLTRESIGEMATFFTLIGGSYSNPIDTANPNREQMRRIMEILERDTNLDNLVLLNDVRWNHAKMIDDNIDDNIEVLAEIKERAQKPVMAILPAFNPAEMEKAAEAAGKFQQRGIPVFPSIERGARALKNALDYYQRRTAMKEI